MDKIDEVSIEWMSGHSGGKVVAYD
jgi:hypothetical protein